MARFASHNNTFDKTLSDRFFYATLFGLSDVHSIKRIVEISDGSSYHGLGTMHIPIKKSNSHSME